MEKINIINRIRTTVAGMGGSCLNFIYLIIFSALITEPLLAQDNTEDIFTMSLEKLLQVKILGSTLTEENLKTVPSAVTVFTHNEINKMGLDSLDELMNLVPGYQSYRSTTTSMHAPFSSRGRRIGGSAAEILLLIDGKRLDSPRSSGSALIIQKFPIDQIERVEFIRGPGAAIYGSNAMMGVINIITRTHVNDVSISYGSLNRRQAKINVSKDVGKATVDVFGFIDKDDGDDYHVLDTFGPDRISTDDPREQVNLNLKLRWENTRINIQHYQFKVDNYYEIGVLSDGYNQREGRLDSISITQNIAWQSVKSWFCIDYKHAKLDVSTQGAPAGALFAISNPPSADALLVRTDSDGYSEVRAQLHNDWSIDQDKNLQYGLELRQINSHETYTKSNFDLIELDNGIIPVTYYSDMSGYTPVQKASKRDIFGLYGQYQHHFNMRTQAYFGLRYDNFSGIGSQVSPRLGFVHQLNDQQSLKLLYGKAYRAPAENELNLLNNPAILGNSDLDPETVQSWDVIWMGQWNGTSISLGYFENHFEDSIVQADDGTGVLQFENIDQDPAKGVELEVSQEINKQWLVRASYTHLTEKPDLSFREADRLASFMVNYQRDRVNANLVATYSGERDMPTGSDINNRIILDDYWLLFGKFSYRVSSNWRAYLQVKNLLDEDYLTPAIATNLSEGVPNRGREILAGITWNN